MNDKIQFASRATLLGLAALGLSASLMAGPAPAKPDSTESDIRAAQRAYKAGQLLDAKHKLDQASAQIAAAAARKLEGYLPEPIDGWTVASTDTAAGAEMTVLRSYAKGERRLTISISADARTLAELAFMVMDTAQAKQAGAKIVKIQGNTGVITQDGQVQMLVAARFLVMAEGDAGEAEKNAYLEKIDTKGLSKL